jgi:hypothetical protein
MNLLWRLMTAAVIYNFTLNYFSLDISGSLQVLLKIKQNSAEIDGIIMLINILVSFRVTRTAYKTKIYG